MGKGTIVGRKITGIRNMTHHEMDALAWLRFRPGVVIVLDDGTRIVASQDEECNGPGAFAYIDAKDAR